MLILDYAKFEICLEIKSNLNSQLYEDSNAIILGELFCTL